MQLLHGFTFGITQVGIVALMVRTVPHHMLASGQGYMAVTHDAVTSALREHLITSARDLAVDMAPDPEKVGDLAKRVAEKLPEIFTSGSTGIADLFSTPEQREKLAGLTAVMSLLEGHADVVMDDVGPTHIPTVAEIRAKFTERRKGAGALDVLLRRLLGLEAKMRQYRDGAAFVRGVQEKVGVDGFNAVWTSPETLPLAAEITDPALWVARVHG